jgi:hypothetical protein
VHQRVNGGLESNGDRDRFESVADDSVTGLAVHGDSGHETQELTLHQVVLGLEGHWQQVLEYTRILSNDEFISTRTSVPNIVAKLTRMH